MYEDETVSEEEARDFTKEIDGVFLLVSAIIGNNCTLLLTILVQKFFEQKC